MERIFFRTVASYAISYCVWCIGCSFYIWLALFCIAAYFGKIAQNFQFAWCIGASYLLSWIFILLEMNFYFWISVFLIAATASVFVEDRILMGPRKKKSKAKRVMGNVKSNGVSPRSPALPPKQGSVEQTMMLLDEYEDYKENLPDHDDLILVLGNTGAGKTTLTKLLTHLEDLEVYQKNFELLIKDVKEHKISEDSTIISKTIFPDLQVDESAQAAFYDLPGFCDTRNPAVELANAFFTRDVTQNANRVKILLVANHNSLRAGQYRRDFIDFLKQVADVILSPEKLPGAFCLVATKVDTASETLIPAMAQFIHSLRQDIPNVIETQGQREKVIAIIDAILKKDFWGNFTRLGVVCRPTQAGKLADSPAYKAQLEALKQVIHGNCKYAKVEPEDFGTSVSPEGRLFVQSVSIEVFSQITKDLTALGNLLSATVKEQVENAPASSLRAHIRVQQRLKEFQDTLSTDKTYTKFLRNVKRMISEVVQDGSFPELTDINREKGRLLFLEEIQGDKFQRFPRQDWISPIRKSVVSYEGHVSDISKKFSLLMTQRIEKLGGKVIRSIRTKSLEREAAVEQCRIAKRVLENTVRRIGGAPTVEKVIWVLQDTVDKLNLAPLDVQDLMENDGFVLSIDSFPQDKETLIHSWTQPLKDVCNALESLKETETFQAELEKRDRKMEKLERRLGDMERDKRRLEEREREKNRRRDRLVENLEDELDRRNRALERLNEEEEEREEERRRLRRRVRTLEERPESDCSIQ